MPGFSFLDNEKLEIITEYIYDLKDGDKTDLSVMNEEVFYTSTGYNKFLTKDGYPAINPPWGTLSSINLNTGKIDLDLVPLSVSEKLENSPYILFDPLGNGILIYDSTLPSGELLKDIKKVLQNSKIG